jgi:hypothetical protein
MSKTRDFDLYSIKIHAKIKNMHEEFLNAKRQSIPAFRERGVWKIGV